MKISLLMLTYNREALVSRAIDSMLNQTFSDFEYIIVDNGSTDKSGAVADEYAARDSRIRVIHKERGNIGSGRNAGLDAARGEYIAFIDDDDWCEPDYLEFLYGLASDNGADVSICGACVKRENVITAVGIPEFVVMNAEEAVIELLWRKRYNNGFPTKLFARRVFDSLRFSNSGQYDDVCLMYKAIMAARKIVSYGLPKYRVLRHAGNNSSATLNDSMITPEYIEEYRAAYRERTNYLCEKFPGNSAYWWYFDWSFQISMVRKIVENNLNCPSLLNRMRDELSRHRSDFINCPYVLDFEKEWMRQYVAE